MNVTLGTKFNQLSRLSKMSRYGSRYVPTRLRAQVLTAVLFPTMFMLMIKIIIRKACIIIKYLGHPKCLCLLLPSALLLLWPSIWWLAEKAGSALQPPRLPGQDLHHYRRNRNLNHYLTQIQVLIEPSSVPCGSLDEVPVVILVTSAPHRLQHRQAVRDTWAKYQPTYFVLGLNGDNVDEQLLHTYKEAKQYSDLIVFDFTDHYQNLTLKTALMMKWSLQRCPQAKFFFKTDDDVLVNPWTLHKLLKEHEDAQLFGYNFSNRTLYRNYYSKWYTPRWLVTQDRVCDYISGTAYLINGNYLEKIFKAAARVPMINIEDLYFTGLVANDALGLNLTHDRRLYPFRPWPLTCIYRHLASIHSFAPEEMITAWSKIKGLGEEANDTACWFFNTYLVKYVDLLL